MKTKRRDKLRIIAEILEITRDITLKTQIMYKANLSYSQLTEYIDFLLNHNLMEKKVNGRKEIFRATEKGLEFLRKHNEINLLLKMKETDYRNEVKMPPENLLKKG